MMKGVSRSKVCNGVLCATTISGNLFIAIFLGKFHRDQFRAVGQFSQMAVVKRKGIFPKCPFIIQVEKLESFPHGWRLLFVNGLIALVNGLVSG